ncbi:MAG: histidine--tRNA ligase [Candidatus Pacebacteria bacterium CG_4_10_14_3_um_filter_34_15]|nr:histidine--tRNA ligase [Candidatus Pacearchaeota archaeon]NCQ65426.1 histidine--tRNA ligase [Candidatus Paceibacterota bacterium]OIO44196.1 MAG: histidine--tRNA ligase [Candidatus Pacebacteria bacterium CG1_02_43_31]PIQ80806.1 MAG: histidine--tRNA ligase [Candidatus Pacebacteria bacterium CG11_big_fil_rev_8_21_14_0_20_34_55]PIX81079.1 MAG: histidine--tRNA ligase [Candidatus Pacebacteria bacterium CG_4_10_14_3_um_filter_34_15]PJC43348.1 MAG: histidine--tRNA ligase [Candidatus Pacebacteria ba
MKNNNIQTLKGFRDILPIDARKRQWVRDSMIKTAEKWGYEPIETPTLEPFELFEGEIGEDEKLFYKFTDNGGREVIMRYDQTVPTCRYVAANYEDLTLPFRRYQIQSVFRAEKPQKGRYREFTQFDLDIFGVKGAEADAEVIAENLETYLNLGFKKPVIVFNSRELMKGIPYEAIVAIDKLKKIGRDGVIRDMIKKGIAQTQANAYFQQVMDIKPNETIKTIITYLENSGFSNEFYRFEPTLARSFSYSEGPIWEIIIEDYEVGSVGGGERYDSMMKRLTNFDIPATGIAFGFDRTVEAADQLRLIPQTSSSQVLVTTFNKIYQNQTLEIAKKLRQAEVKTELYPDITDKIGKQFKYADKKRIPYAIVIGEEEVAQNKVSLKNLQTRDQEMLSVEEVIKKLA